jgi:UDP-2,4-diacetamido-2,4,6-trideoxy-beta-L-altropyranose hydrolase
MRALALAQAWRRAGGETLFALAESTAAIEQRLRAEDTQFRNLRVEVGSAQDAEQTIVLANAHHARWVIADGYHFGDAYQLAIKNAGLRLLVVDDYGHAEHYYSDIVLNQNLQAREELYARRERYTRLLLGTCYVLLREQFLAYRDSKHTIAPVARKVLVTLGGADPANATPKVVEALRGLDVEAKIVIGGSNLHGPQLQAAFEGISGTEVLYDVRNMPELMAWADVAVSSGGTTVWELAFMGLPSIIGHISFNQEPVVRELAHLNIFTALGSLGEATTEQIRISLQVLLSSQRVRGEMSRRSRELVDGGGAGRVLTYLRDDPVRLRPARVDDSRLLWEWANDAETRALSFSQAPIPWNDHQKWFASKLADRRCFVLIGLDRDDQPIGSVRLDTEPLGRAVLSINLSPPNRGLGYGTQLIRMASAELVRLAKVRVIHAFVKPSNGASLRAFEKAGFSREKTETATGNPAIHYVFRSSEEVV